MATIKELVQDLQPTKLYFVLILTCLFFLTEFVVSHLTHSLTLLMDSYFTLCNIVALLGYIFTVKYSTKQNAESCDSKSTISVSESSNAAEESTLNPCKQNKKAPSSPTDVNREKKLKNTFGWARIDVMTMLIRCVFLGSLSFSTVVEALQTLVHIGHMDEMHHCISVLFVGVAGLLMNFICYVMIGGYNFHQGSFLYITKTGEVYLDKVTVDANKKARYATLEHRQSVQGMVRDSVGCILVILCAFIVYWTDKDMAKFVDPVMAIISATSLMIFSYPFMKESCLILLQTIPGSINIEIIKSDLLKNFPDIANIHDFHIWQLSATKIISTVHIIFKNPELYTQVNKQIELYFSQNGISHVTIQPEFYLGASKNNLSNNATPECLMQCQKEACKSSHCCPDNIDPHSNGSKTNLKTVKICDGKNGSLSNISTKSTTNNKSVTISKSCDNLKHNEIKPSDKRHSKNSILQIFSKSKSCGNLAQNNDKRLDKSAIDC